MRNGDQRMDRREELKMRVRNDFIFHPVIGDQDERYQMNREKFLELALFIVDSTPVSREQSLCLTALEEAMFWANAAIARNPDVSGQ